jgi:IS5 family transposase
MALATILQAYMGISDDEVIEELEMDRRWQLVLDCLDSEKAPFSKATLVRFRAALIAKGLDRRLVEKTIAMAHNRQGFCPRYLRAALDSSPLWGAARVEDTYNLLGHALRKALMVIARIEEKELATVAAEGGAQMVVASSLKASLDLDWDDPLAKAEALETILKALEQVESRMEKQTSFDSPTAKSIKDHLQVGRQIEAQDVEKGADGSPKLKRGVAKNRRIAIEDEQMRHGRKSRKVRFDGYKRHVLKDLDSGLVRAVGITPANLPEAVVTEAIAADLQKQKVSLEQLHIDRGYLSSSLVKEAEVCGNCPERESCTTSKRGRTVSIHPDEKLLTELRQRQTTAAGRAQLRERVTVEHTLAHIGQWQGKRARYFGSRKNLFDLRRTAVVHNLHVIARMPDQGFRGYA